MKEFVDAPIPIETPQLRTEGGSRGKVEVFSHGHMWKERVILKDVAAAADASGEVKIARRIVETLPIDENAPVVGPSKSRKTVERQRFSGPARAKKTGDARLKLEMNVQLKFTRVLGWRKPL